MAYIRVPKVYEKLKKAEEFYAPVIMTAAYGYGKSAAVEYYYRRKKPLTLYCKNGNLTEMPSPDSFRGNVVIIEDLQWLSEESGITYLKELLEHSGRQIVMLTRGEIPKYLAAESMRYGFVRIREEDFCFGEKEVEAFFREKGISLSADEAAQIAEASKGYAIAVHFYADHMESGEHYSDRLKEAVWHDLFHLWDGCVYEQWSYEFRSFALSLCPYESFTIAMAEYLTGNKRIGELIEYCREKTNQLRYQEAGNYSIRFETRRYFLWKRELTWGSAEIIENYRRAANYYESRGDIPNALKYYEKAGATQRVKEMLIRNANTHPGNGHYVETKEYYFKLPEEEIKGSPVLMAGMSMLYDLILLPDKSEEWYEELKKYCQDKRNSRELRREARARLAYLDIGLPHHGSKGILDIMKDVYALIRKGDIVLPEFSATGNMPSIMNGGLDFCEWSKSDRQIAKFMEKPLQVILGKYGKGLITLGLAESGFEKGSMAAYEILTRCNDGYEAAAHGGKIEMCFVSVGVQVRQHLSEGQLPSAKRVCDSFAEKVKAEAATQLIPNLEAFEEWLALYSGSGDRRERYAEKVPDAKTSFCVLDRYRQMVKLRCLIAENRLEEAFDLCAFLTGYFESYHRSFLWMENEVLKAIILFRMGDGHWKDHMKNALQRSEEYHFIRIVSFEGAAVLPLLNKLKEEKQIPETGSEFFEKVYEETMRIAMFYPDYLRFIPKETVVLTSREAQVLSMLCAGMTTEDICEALEIGYDGLKKHNRNIYKKLGVKNRAEAERKALRLGLVHQGSTMKSGGSV